MSDRPTPDPGEMPSPGLVAAWVALDTVPSGRIPLCAAHWLVDGHDGASLRELAGLGGTEIHEIRDILPAALADCGTAVPDSAAAAAQVAFTDLARMHADGRASELWVLNKVYEIILRSDYDGGVVELPLGRIADLADEWEAGWGRPRDQLEREIQQACRAQLASASARRTSGGSC
ncbi:hypothetical protein ACFWM1_23140 [Nocardia sp. NPDC058379]|uniref:hypothetical protein n=1 Tax=unclassified Nocardia TaxID=2637762 RepID=UPI003658B517